MRILLPKAHGAWAMLILPFILGIGLGDFNWLHVPAFFGWLLLYIATNPLIMIVKKKKVAFHRKWLIGYSIAASLFLGIVLINMPTIMIFGVLMIPFFITNIYFALKNKERALLNDLAAINAFSLGGVTSYFIGVGQIDIIAFYVWLFSILFFMGSTFFVKTLIREKRNPAYRWFSWAFHISVIVLMIGLGLPLLALAYLPSVIRAVWCYGKEMTPKQVGILEISNSIYFLVIINVII